MLRRPIESTIVKNGGITPQLNFPGQMGHGEERTANN